MEGKLMALFEALIVIVIALVLFPVVNSFVTAAAVNQSAAITALVNLIPLFWILAAVGLAVALIYFAFRHK